MAISGRHPRSVPAAVKTVLAPRFVIARSEATWQSREGTAVRNEPPLNRHAPPICHCEERSDVAISGRYCRSVRAIEKRHAPPICHCEEAGGRRGNLGKAPPIRTGRR